MGLRATVVIMGIAATVWLAALLLPDTRQAVNTRVNAAPIAVASGPPRPQTLARIEGDRGEPDLALQVPINQRVIKAIGYDSVADTEALSFSPEGRRANGSLLERVARKFLATEQPAALRYVTLGNGEKQNAVQIAAPPGAEAYAPIAATVIAIVDNRINGDAAGVTIHLQPLGDPETIVLMSNLDVAAGVAVGQKVAAGETMLGAVRAPAPSRKEPIARYTHDDGPNLQMVVHRLQGAPSF